MTQQCFQGTVWGVTARSFGFLTGFIGLAQGAKGFSLRTRRVHDCNKDFLQFVVCFMYTLRDSMVAA